MAREGKKREAKGLGMGREVNRDGKGRGGIWERMGWEGKGREEK